MDLEVLISTMNINSETENKKLIKKMKIKGKSLTISQTKKDTLISNGTQKSDNRIIYDEGIGLSRSRNIALKNAMGDVVLIADDDVKYENDYETIIKQAYSENPDADMIAFFVQSENPKRKIRKLKKGKIGWIKIFRVASVEITFNRKRIENSGLKFDEKFGIGTEFYCGEETIFLSDCLRKKMKLLYVDKKIGSVEQKQSTWFKGITKEYINVEKEVFKRISPKFWRLLWIQFIIRKVIPGVLLKCIRKKENKR